MAKEGYKIDNQEGMYFLSFAIVEWIDVFTRSMYADIIIASLQFCRDKKGLELYAWCIMSNHIHLICSAKNGNLSDILRDFKSFTSKEIIKTIEKNEKESRKNWMLWLFRNAASKNKRNSKYQFWKQDNHPIELLSFQNSFAIQKLDYLHNNPVVAGIVDSPEDYRYSSARNYTGEVGLLDVLFF